MASRRAHLLALASAALLLAGCATAPGGPGGSAGGAIDPVIPAPGQVRGIGTVIQIADATPQLCLGAVAESYPPQCTGVPVTDWTWSDTDGHETSGGTQWGTFAVTGTWDGTTLATTGSVQLALYDPIRTEDPLLDPANAGDTAEADLEAAQTDVDASFPVEVLSSSIENGYVFVQVVYDDGRLQAWADATYLPDVVVVRPALADLT